MEPLPAWALKPDYTYTGLVIAGSIILAWASALRHALTLEMQTTSRQHIAVLFTSLIELNTALFITAHDAMHGLVAPRNPKLNRILGQLCVACYAAFDYDLLLVGHRQHHAHPGTNKDPDFYDGSSGRWFVKFMWTYTTLGQLLRMGAIAFCMIALGVPVQNMLFWVVPPLCSAVQLFIVGTYLPHRKAAQPFKDRHRARSLDFSSCLSIISCFNFGGAHHEHHIWTRVPWWRLHLLKAFNRAIDTSAR